MFLKFCKNVTKIVINDRTVILPGKRLASLKAPDSFFSKEHKNHFLKKHFW